MKKAEKALSVIEKTITTLFVSTIVSTIFFQVLVRYVFKISVSWLEELARFTFIWSALFGGALAYNKGVLHKIEILEEKLPKRYSTIIEKINPFFILFILGILLIYGIKLSAFVYSQLSPALRISMTFVYTAVPFSSSIMLIITIINFIKLFRSRNKK